MATKKLASTKKAAKPKAKSAKPPKPLSPGVKVPKHFVAPDWGNVLAPPAVVVPTGDAAIDEALGKLFAGDDSDTVRELAERASTSSLIAMFSGPALQYPKVYWNDDVVDTLPLGDKRKQKKVYWAAESAKIQRERLFVWFANQLVKTPEGRAHLLELAAGDHAARMRGLVATALRKSKPDAALMRAIAEAIDPTRWVGAVETDTTTWLGHTYTVGAMAAIAIDPAAAYARFAPLLEPSAIKGRKAEIQAASVCWGIKNAIAELGVDPDACEMFTPALATLTAVEDTKHFAMHGLRALPPHPAVAEAAQRLLGPTPGEVPYWNRDAVELIATSSDPKYIPWLAAALAASWMNWGAVFEGLGKIGDPVGTAIIERWLEDNAADDRTEAAEPILASLRKRGGEPTPEHRATAERLLTEFAKKKPKKKK